MPASMKTMTALAVLAAAVAVYPSQAATEERATAPATKPVAMDDAHRAKAQELIDKGIGYLVSQRQADSGWSMDKGVNKPAITAMVLKALVQSPDYGPNSDVVKKGFEVLLGFRQKDGGIYDPETGYQNYTTSLAVMALVTAGNPQYNEALRDAVTFLKRQQIAAGSESPDGRKIDKDHPFFGGVSYGKEGRPDLSNVGMWAEALHEAGVSGDDPAMQNMLVFLSRTQNRSESNTLPWAKRASNDGGFIYAPATKPGRLDSPESKADPEQGLRSYGSMTYVGFKSMLYAGLAKDDPRVRAAFDWIAKYWRLDSNPNMPQTQSKQGLYYYYYVFAKALRAWGQPVITDPNGLRHNWRQELIDTLAAGVSQDGSWVNMADRWQEGSPVLVTAYCVMALQETMMK